jgi:proton-dependent oligopeptide transporter, POT family
MFKKHPIALPVCFTTEMWERFGYKIILGLLVFVLLKRFNLTDAEAAGITGAFTGLLYITSILAGYIADNYIGYYRSVLLGATVLIIGYLLLAASSTILLLSVSLGVISVGTGLLKTNISSYLGASYAVGDSNRDKGFTVFYAGINIGSMLGNFTAGYFYDTYGSAISFTIASAGILLGLATFYFGFKKSGLKPLKADVHKYGWINSISIILFGIIISTIVIYLPDVSIIFFIAITLGSIFIIFKTSKGIPDQYKKSTAFLLFLLIAIIFWSIYNQMFLSMNLFIDRLVTHSFFGIPMTTQAFIITNNISVIVLGFSVIKLWSYLDDTKKYVLGSFLLCFVFVIVIVGIQSTNPMLKIAGYWIILAYIMLSMSEICISPIGLSLASKLAPRDGIGIFMGLWLVAAGIGGFLAGVIAKYAAIDKDNLHSITSMKASYLQAFDIYIWIACIGFILSCIIAFIIRKIIKDLKI